MSQFLLRKVEDIGQKAISERGRFAVALSGGKTPVRFYGRLAGHDEVLPWRKIHIFLVDERFVPHDHQDSNRRMLTETLLDKISIPEGNIHLIQTGQGSLEISAQEYERELERFFNVSAGQFPVFDLILLGLGEDGHTASLFPGTEALEESRHLVAAVALNEERHHRITLTLPVINHSKHVVFLVAGRRKAVILEKVIRDGDPALPASRVNPEKGEILFLSDREAGSLLSGPHE